MLERKKLNVEMVPQSSFLEVVYQQQQLDSVHSIVFKEGTCQKISGYDFNLGIDYPTLLKSMLSTGESELINQEEGGVYLAMRREATLRLGEGEGGWEVLLLQGRWRVMIASGARKMEIVVGTSVCGVSAQDEKMRRWRVEDDGRVER
ncbi:hypothetical protein MRB53_025152 [Persea americana]|uniref:Uncharacterized protein n=1 Tax=Persea americana TaxID=3435 RepID=A0ACC2LFK7_PERAE|nr:hypothetical protein MRB53_025152 [Persea americana]